MTRLGMDVEVVEATGRQLKGKGQAISAVVRSVDALVNSADAQWWGARSRSFVTDWRSVHRPALLQAAAAVDGLGQSALNQAGEQRGVSSAGGGGHASGADARRVADPDNWKDALSLAMASYGGEPPEGYRRITADELRRMGLSEKDLHDPKSGFDADVFVDAQGHYVISYRGTENWTEGKGLGTHASRDVHADVTGAVYVATQTERAAYLAKMVVSAGGKDNVVAVGHSLGGRHAAIASVVTGVHAVTFNSAGVSNAELTYALTLRGDDADIGDYIGAVFGAGDIAAERNASVRSGLIVNHVTDTDPLTGVQSTQVPSLPGSPTVAPGALGRTEVHHSDTGLDLISSHNFKGVD